MEKIQVNALFGFDNIKIVATANVKNNIIYIHEEKIYLGDKRDEVKNAIKKAIKSIETKISKKITNVNIVFDDHMKKSELLGINTKILEEKIRFNTDKLLDSNDYRKIIEAMIKKSRDREADKELISIVPFKFICIESNNDLEKESNSFPIGKKMSGLKVIFSVRYMNKQKYLRSIEYFDALDLKINSVTLESQLSIYGFRNSNEFNNKVEFIISIQKNKTILISCVNNVAIKTDNLEYSFENLIAKIAQNFDISFQEANNLISCYGKINIPSSAKDDVIYSSSREGESKIITKSNIAEIIKSFLKSICQEANIIINGRIKNSSNKFEVKLIGELAKNLDIINYCSKYFDKTNISHENESESIYAWNKSYNSVRNYWSFVKMLNNIMNPEALYYETENTHNKNNATYNQKQVYGLSSEKTEALLA